MKFDAS